jgi:hypothetical protein
VTAFSAALRQQVIKRAGNRCEYCGLSQAGQEASFHIDHVLPVKAGGLTVRTNLALACVSCSLRKGARQLAADPKTQQEVPLFNPRVEPWGDHFRWDDLHIVGLTATGRASVQTLQMNRPLILEIRREEVARNRHPPSTK